MAGDKLSEEALAFFRKQGAKGGKLSGPARMKKLTPEERSEIAKKAARKSAEVRSTKSKKAAAKSAEMRGKKRKPGRGA